MTGSLHLRNVEQRSSRMSIYFASGIDEYLDGRLVPGC
jgi:hypothetical protein